METQNINNLSFRKLIYYITKEIYFSVEKGIYQKNIIYFENMKVNFNHGYTFIKEGKIDLENLVINPNPPLIIYTSSFETIIQKDPLINLKKLQIEGYHATIKYLKNNKKDKITHAYKIKIDILKNQVCAYQSKGIW